jgi:hypothetical protein
MISDFPEEVAWLSPEERQFIKARLQQDVGESQRHQTITAKGIFDVLRELKILLGGLMYFGLIVPAYSYGLWIPSCLGAHLLTARLRSILCACDHSVFGT